MQSADRDAAFDALTASIGAALSAVQLSVLDRDLTAPPGLPADGDRYIVASGGTGDWVGWDLNVVLWTDGAWLRLPPRTGWRAWIEDEGLLLVYEGSGWIGPTPPCPRTRSRCARRAGGGPPRPTSWRAACPRAAGWEG